MFPNKCTLMPQCPSVNAQKEKKQNKTLKDTRSFVWQTKKHIFAYSVYVMQ